MDPPRLILAVRVGPSRGKKAVLRAGDVLSVGRTAQSGFVFPNDTRLSAKHFQLQWDGARARLEVFEGTMLNGEAVSLGETPKPPAQPVSAVVDVPHGAWIRAGATDFTVHVEGHTPPPVEDEDEDEDEEAALADLPAPGAEGDDAPPFPAEDPEPEPEDGALHGDLDDEQRWNVRTAARQARLARAERRAAADRALPILEAAAAREPLHVLLDAARTPRIVEVLREAVEEHRSLYEGVQGEALEDVAPYLVRIEPGSRLLRQILSEGWTRRWGIFIEGLAPQKQLRRHLRRFLMVEDASGAPLYFRYYDPGVLRAFWPTCSRRQLTELTGPLRAFLVEGPRGEVLRLGPEGSLESLTVGEPPISLNPSVTRSRWGSPPYPR